MNHRRQNFHTFLLLLTAFLWGTTFVAQRTGAELVGPFTFLAMRSWIAVLFLTPVIPLMDRLYARRGMADRKPRSGPDRLLLLKGGILCGMMLGAASAAQQIGIGYTSASKAGFITSLYVVLVPVLSIFLRRQPSPRVWVGVLLALIGLYLLCMKADRFSLTYGDAWVLLCALFFAVQILLLDRYSPLVDAVRLSRAQFLVVALLSTVLMLLTEHPDSGALVSALPSILYAGVFSSGIAYTLQIIGQDGVNPSVASLVMSLESVFSAFAGWLVLHERLTVRELIGAALMFAAVLLTQLMPPSEPRESRGRPV